jgi:hypothetical protein
MKRGEVTLAQSNKRRPRRMATDSGTVATSGDGSTAPSERLDGTDWGQVGEQCGYRQ